VPYTLLCPAFEVTVTSKGLTVKLTLKLCEMPLLPLTVTVAVYVLASSPVFGVTWNVALPPTAIPAATLLLEIEKLLALVPDNSTVNAPVGWLPVLFTVTVNGVGAVVYPNVVAGNTYGVV
jgi:hypothetical protein